MIKITSIALTVAKIDNKGRMLQIGGFFRLVGRTPSPEKRERSEQEH